MFGGMSVENVARFKRQNKKKISVIIGNPPYNANQLNENENNKNRLYPEIDRRIKATYIAASSAQKTKQYDMFVRFFRWATDRLPEQGILAFITNRSFIDKRNFDGFRKSIAGDFSDIYVIDLGGDWKLKGTGGGGNVFGIGTGVAISFCIKKSQRAGATQNARIWVSFASEHAISGEEKLTWVNTNACSAMTFLKHSGDELGYWVAGSTHQMDGLPIASKDTKSVKRKAQERAIFKLFSLGVVTNRDDWVYGNDPSEVATKIKHLISVYGADLRRFAKRRKQDHRAGRQYRRVDALCQGRQAQILL